MEKESGYEKAAKHRNGNNTFLSACQFSIEMNNGGEEEEGSATSQQNNRTELEELPKPELQVTIADQEVGSTLENDIVYQLLDDVIEENPSIGIANDFYMTTVEILENENDGYLLLFIAVNRIGDAIKDVQFNLDIRTADGTVI